MTRLFSIRFRLMASVSLLFLLALLIGVAGLLGLRDANRAHEQTFTNQFPSALS
ncbi:Tar ligand binding domain-containing protein, partial [Ralstonia psammae]|uniref:Tar ligand binding domain-containing protein n=1 Tax=Ralstonia psammae TaxID=3058598 RepID=UPI00292DC503